jgi:hypothetical protein
MNPFWDEKRPMPRVVINGIELSEGSLVRLHPRPGGDIFDLALAGKTAVVETIEQDFEDVIYIAVTLEDDPGRDLGLARQPGHRFFFSTAEIEPLGTSPVVESSPAVEP